MFDLQALCKIENPKEREIARVRMVAATRGAAQAVGLPSPSDPKRLSYTPLPKFSGVSDPETVSYKPHANALYGSFDTVFNPKNMHLNLSHDGSWKNILGGNVTVLFDAMVGKILCVNSEIILALAHEFPTFGEVLNPLTEELGPLFVNATSGLRIFNFADAAKFLYQTLPHSKGLTIPEKLFRDMCAEDILGQESFKARVNIREYYISLELPRNIWEPHMRQNYGDYNQAMLGACCDLIRLKGGEFAKAIEYHPVVLTQAAYDVPETM